MKLRGSWSQKPHYQTEQAQRGTLVISVTASGHVSSANSATVATQTSGVVSKIYVKNGQLVKSGDQIAEMDLDLDGKQRAAQAFSSYQSAKNTLDTANANYFSLQSTMLTQWKTYMDIAQSGSYQNSDLSPRTDQRQLPQFMTTSDDWLAAEAKFKIQQQIIAQTQTAVNSAWASYQQASPIIYAPISGAITGLSLQVGAVLTAQTGSSGNSTAQRIANIKTAATPTIMIELAQIDAPKVKIGNKATIKLDALPDKTFTGEVVSVDTVGMISSGVTSYPTVIKLDVPSDDMYSNMSATASIITKTRNDVVLVPVSAVQNQNGQASVRVLANETMSLVPVEIGDASDAQTEILSGIREGDTVVTSVISQTGTRTQGSTSPFSAFGGRGFGGGAFRVGGR